MSTPQSFSDSQMEKVDLPLSDKSTRDVPSLTPEEEYRQLQELRSGGRYVPPAKLRALLKQINFQKGSREIQKLEWEKLKKAINGLVNKANTSNIKTIVVGLFQLNLNRGQGLFVRSVMKGQSLALPFTDVYASLVAIINSKLPHIGNLLISRLVLQFKKAYKRNNKEICLSSTTFLAHLVNHQVAHEILALELLHLLLNNPTDDSIEIAINLIKHVGLLLTEVCPKALSDIFETLRQLLQEQNFEKRTQYMIEVLFNVRRDEYKDFPAISEGLDLVEDEDQITHTVHLTEQLKAQENLNVFQVDDEYEKHEGEYNLIRIDILGDDQEEDEEEGIEEEVEVNSSENETNDSSNPIESVVLENNSVEDDLKLDIHIKDVTEANKTNFRKNIYLVLKGSMSPDEAVHKILKLRIRAEDQELAVDTLVKACSQETTYSKYYGVSGEKLAGQSKTWNDSFEAIFEENYNTIHRYESNPLRNVSKFWGHLLSSDALDWKVLSYIKLTEQHTSSAGRIFIKFLFQELVEELGVPELIKRFSDEEYLSYFEGLFPTNDPESMRFSINYFTAIGLGVLTETTRKNLKEITTALETHRRSQSVSSCSSYSRSRSHSFSRSPSRSDHSNRSHSRSPPRNNYSRTPSRSPDRAQSYSQSEGRASRASYSQDSPQYPSRDREYYDRKQRRERSESPRYRSNYRGRFNNR